MMKHLIFMDEKEHRKKSSCALVTCAEIKNIKAPTMYLLDVGNGAFLFKLMRKVKVGPEDGEVLLITWLSMR